MSFFFSPDLLNSEMGICLDSGIIFQDAGKPGCVQKIIHKMER